MMKEKLLIKRKKKQMHLRNNYKLQTNKLKKNFQMQIKSYKMQKMS